MNLSEIEHNVAELDFSKGFDLIYDLLRAYGLPKASITRLQKGTYNRSEADNERLWKGKLYYRCLTGPDEDLHAVIDEARHDERIMKERPRFLIIRDDDSLVAIDTRTETTLDCDLVDLPAHSAFFLPWAGIEKTQLESMNYADVKAAEKMARLYDEVIKDERNKVEDENDVRHLNIFFSRLLFCFFAEDTRVFDKGSFTNAIASLTKPDGSDTGRLLDELFKVLDTDRGNRQGVPAHLDIFDYVNGSLFAADAPSPQFTTKARRIILECGQLNWSQINPDIFGSMIQAVVHPGQRETLGMHYTSVENIMKVIRPLFLDELEEAFDAADTVGKLEKLLDRICNIKVFDPACGSGNFLVIAYKELRKLEHRILQRIGELDPSKVGLFKLSGIKLDHFYGIEIDDFAHEIAILSLWLAKHQMNVEFHDLFGVEISLIPLRDTGNVMCGNAARLNWEEICPPGDSPVYVLGNPPYRGATYHSDDNRHDLALVFAGRDFDRRMDYISAWFMKGARYVARNDASLGFVSTNSVCQGGHVEMLWPHIFDEGVQISFAHTSFAWTNQAKGKAGVTVVVVGLDKEPRHRTLYADGVKRRVDQIGPYLTAGNSSAIVGKRDSSICGLPKMDYGSKPVDGGGLSLDASEADALLAEYPEAAEFLRGYMGSAELIRGTRRHCLWIPAERVGAALAIPGVAQRVERVRRFRLASKKESTRRDAGRAWQFQQIRHKDTASIIIPRHSSERRDYIPMGFLDQSTIISDAAMAIYDAEPWMFGVIHSRMHMTWVRAVGGRIKTDFRYSAELVYNNFPIPRLDDTAKNALNECVFGVLEQREYNSDKTLAELYDPERMPVGLRGAHKNLDDLVDSVYRERPFESDDQRLELLFGMYEELKLQDGVLTLA